MPIGASKVSEKAVSSRASRPSRSCTSASSTFKYPPLLHLLLRRTIGTTLGKIFNLVATGGVSTAHVSDPIAQQNVRMIQTNRLTFSDVSRRFRFCLVSALNVACPAKFSSHSVCKAYGALRRSAVIPCGRLLGTPLGLVAVIQNQREETKEKSPLPPLAMQIFPPPHTNLSSC